LRWDDWCPSYLDIVKRLNLDSAADREATALLTELLESIDPRPMLDRLSETINRKDVIICGAGPSLERHLKSFFSSADHEDYVIVAADGAVSDILELGLHCDIVVTDLDGDIEHIMRAKDNGALLIVHAHGDNIERVRTVVPDLGEILGSTQVEPTDRAFLWGGFTDGDRACHIVCEYSPRRIVLAGMDFGAIVGKWSKPGHENHFPASERKRIKLEIAEGLMTTLLRTTRVDCLFLT
jgi:uncharacterized Rossmann fold enzyme